MLCIIGKTCSGKDTLAHILERKYQLKPVISYTTRPMRADDIEGVSHYFITERIAEQMLHEQKDNIVAYTVLGGYKYFSLRKELLDSDYYIIDPDGIEYLKKEIPTLNLHKVYIYCDETLIKLRAEYRGTDKDVLERRLTRERERFDTFKNNKGYDKIYNNSVSNIDNLEVIASEIADDLYFQSVQYLKSLEMCEPLGVNRCLDVDIVRVNPETLAIDDDKTKNTKTQVWLEFGGCYYDEQFKRYIPEHNIDYDCGGDTFENAVIQLAKLVKKNEVLYGKT